MNITVYLAGPLSDGDNPHAWHDRIQSLDERIDWINPFTIHADEATGEEIYAGDVEAVRSSDVVLLRRIDGYEVCGAYIESGIAGENDIPVVVWNDCDSEVPEFLEWHSVSICETLTSAVTEVKACGV